MYWGCEAIDSGTRAATPEGGSSRGQSLRRLIRAVTGIVVTALASIASAADPGVAIPSCEEAAPGDNEAARKRLVIIIDDIGHSLPLGQQVVELPGPINVAVLPHQKNSVALAELAHRRGKEVLLHAPMSNIRGKNPGKGTLTAEMNREQLVSTLQANLRAVPHVTGVNNHMGSQLTQVPQAMAWVMETLRDEELFFVDSRTSAGTVAQVKAKLYKLPNLKRDVFLDNERDEEEIRRQLERTLEIARQQGVAVAIGHPYPETIAVLQRTLPGLALRGYRLSSVSDVLQPPPPKCQPEQDYRQLFEPECQLQLASKK